MVAPALEKYRQETVLGGLWKRPGLSARDRSIVTLAGLIARNRLLVFQAASCRISAKRSGISSMTSWPHSSS